MTRVLLDPLPVWALLLLSVAVILGVYLLGFARGGRRGRRYGYESAVGLAGLVGAMQVLLAFMLGFVFAMASDRYHERRQLMLDETNAIGTAWLRARALPPEYAEHMVPLLREYVDLPRSARVEQAGARGGAESELRQAIARSSELQERLWRLTIELARERPDSLPAVLFMEALNNMIDLQQSRITVAQDFRIDPPVWWTLYFITLLTMLLVGYHIGRSGGRWRVALPLVLALTAVLVLNIDLDRPSQRLFQVGDTALADLRQTMDAASPPETAPDSP